MKRKIVSLALAFAMIISVAVFATGCGEKPIDIFKKASENMDGNWISGDGKGTLEVDMGGAKTSFVANFKAAGIAPQKGDKENPLGQMKTTFDMSLMGRDMEGAFYVKGDKVYLDANGVKRATVLEEDVLEKVIAAINKDEKPLDVEKYIKEEKKDGDKIILVIDGKKCTKDVMETKEFKDTMDSEEQSTYQDSLKDMVGDIKIEATVRNEKFTDIKVTCDMKVDMGAIYGAGTGVAAYDMTITIEFKNIKTGKEVKVDWPDFNEFEEN